MKISNYQKILHSWSVLADILNGIFVFRLYFWIVSSIQFSFLNRSFIYAWPVMLQGEWFEFHHQFFTLRCVHHFTSTFSGIGGKYFAVTKLVLGWTSVFPKCLLTTCVFLRLHRFGFRGVPLPWADFFIGAQRYDKLKTRGTFDRTFRKLCILAMITQISMRS